MPDEQKTRVLAMRVAGSVVFLGLPRTCFWCLRPESNRHAFRRLILSHRALPQTAHATLIALTGYGQDADRKRSIAAGFDHHLTKPVDVAALLRLLTSRAGRPSEGDEHQEVVTGPSIWND